MLKQCGLYGLLFFALVSTNEQAYAMKGFANYANAFRMSMQGLSYAGALAFYPWLIKQNERKYLEEEMALRIEPEAENFVRTLLTNAYPELKNRHFEIVRSPQKSFYVINIDNVPHLFVGQECTKDGIKKALLFQKNKLQRYHDQEFATRSQDNNMTVHEFIARGEILGYAMTPRSIHVWNCILKHEGAHILHHDDEKTRALLTTLPCIALYATEKMHQRLSGKSIAILSAKEHILKGIRHLTSLPITLAVVFICMLPFRYYQEYRADQEAIKRTNDPQELKAISMMFSHLPEHKAPTVASKLHKLFNIHPSHTTRARYFKEAAKRLEEQQTQHISVKD